MNMNIRYCFLSLILSVIHVIATKEMRGNPIAGPIITIKFNDPISDSEVKPGNLQKSYHQTI